MRTVLFTLALAAAPAFASNAPDDDGDTNQSNPLAACQVNALTFANVLFNQQGAAQTECTNLLALLNNNNAQCQVQRRGNRFRARLRLLNLINANNLADALTQLTALVNNGKLLADKVLRLQLTNNGNCQ